MQAPAGSGTVPSFGTLLYFSTKQHVCFGDWSQTRLTATYDRGNCLCSVPQYH